MSRSRSFRRAQLAKAKQRARNLYVRVWQVKSRVKLPGARWSIPGPVEEPSATWTGKMASTHCKPCSCPGCGNPRSHFGEPTRQERLDPPVDGE